MKVLQRVLVFAVLAVALGSGCGSDSGDGSSTRADAREPERGFDVGDAQAFQCHNAGAELDRELAACVVNDPGDCDRVRKALSQNSPCWTRAQAEEIRDKRGITQTTTYDFSAAGLASCQKNGGTVVGNASGKACRIVTDNP